MELIVHSCSQFLSASLQSLSGRFFSKSGRVLKNIATQYDGFLFVTVSWCWSKRKLIPCLGFSGGCRFCLTRFYGKEDFLFFVDL